MPTKSESDFTSLAPSSTSRSPKHPVYYMQSPSKDSHDRDKSSSIQPSPMESPLQPISDTIEETHLLVGFQVHLGPLR
ncbi:hypothetical protein JCGZ_18338 [Jatropha curcas]|uniref:Uncharacterized protein n=1 Tax=Jatropha curcas TaxID=180498 RepID=A0A067JZW1_JATCU|nr:hypothetical protein JCGZ_18338 [Jatropha curcas]